MKDDWTIVYCDTVDEIEELVSDRRFIWPLIINSVYSMLESGRSSIVIIEGKLISEGSNISSMWITMSADDVEASLKKCLEWRESIEEYEECAQILSLLNEWQLRNCVDCDEKIADSLL
jgi:hypothetical protein